MIVERNSFCVTRAGKGLSRCPCLYVNLLILAIPRAQLGGFPSPFGWGCHKVIIRLTRNNYYCRITRVPFRIIKIWLKAQTWAVIARKMCNSHYASRNLSHNLRLGRWNICFLMLVLYHVPLSLFGADLHAARYNA